MRRAGRAQPRVGKATPHGLRPHPGTGAAARRGARARPPLRPRVLRGQGEGRRAHHRAVGGGRQARLPRRQHARPSTAAAAAASPSWPSSARSWPPPAARCCCSWSRRRSPATIIARHGTEEQRKRFLPGFADGSLKIVLRDHRAGGRLQLPPARHGGPPGRRRLGAHRPQVLHLRRRRVRRTCWWWPGPPTRGPASSSPALFLVPTDAPGLTTSQAGHGDRLAGEPVAALPRRRPAARRRAGRRTPTPACRRCSPGSTRSGSRSPRWAPAPPGTPWNAPSAYTATRKVWGRPIGTHQGVAHPLAHAAHPGGTGPADDRQGGGALRRRPRPGGRRGRQHGQVRLRRGRGARRGHRDPGARRQRHDHRVRRGDPARRASGPAGSPRSAAR